MERINIPYFIASGELEPQEYNNFLVNFLANSTFSYLQVKAGSICFCLIDDCLDADVPLVELAFTSKSSTYFLFENNVSIFFSCALRCQFPNVSLHQLGPYVTYVYIMYQ